MFLAGILGISRTGEAISAKFLIQVRAPIAHVCRLCLLLPPLYQAAILIASMTVTYGSVSSLQAKRGLPLPNQVIGWICFGKADHCITHLMYLILPYT